MVKTRTVMFAVLAAVVAIAAGCGSSSGDSSGGGSTPASSSGPVKLTMWWWGDQEAAGMKNFVADSVQKYEAAHPNITIDTVLQSTDNLMPNFAAAAKAKKGPDIEYRWGGIWTPAGCAGTATSRRSPTTSRRRSWPHYLNASEDTSGGKLLDRSLVRPAVVPGALPQGHPHERGHHRSPTTWTQLLADCNDAALEGHHARSPAASRTAGSAGGCTRSSGRSR